MDDITYFLSSFQKLERISNDTNCSHEDLLFAASILYIFFIDGAPVFHRINKEIKYEPTFKYEPPKTKRGLVASFGEFSVGKKNILPDDSKWRNYERAQLLDSLAYVHGEKDFSVRDLIKFYRNEKGGAHFPPKETATSLRTLSEINIEINGRKQDPFDLRMRIIIRSITNGLKPFIAMINTS